MKIFVVNCGSSSIKYQLFNMTDESVLARGLCERVGTVEARLTHEADGNRTQRQVDAPDHFVGMKLILEALLDGETAVLASLDELDGIGHRVVHGGEQLTDSARIDDRVLSIIEENAALAPLHNPPNLAGIRAAMDVVPHIPQVAVFDTAFLSTMPPRAFRYAVPEDWYSDYHVRKYGFHGTSHRYVTLVAAKHLSKDPGKVNLITAHLGNGCSMTAVAAGKAVDHSMGMTPLEGLVMGTRSGDIDPAVVLHMASSGLSWEDIDRSLNKQSGLLGLSGVSNDMRDLLAAVDSGNQRAALAVEMFVYRIVKYVGAYRAVLPSLDALVLTGGIGENSCPVRQKIVEALASLGARLDSQANARTIRGLTGRITTQDSALAVWVVPTNEELMIARDTAGIVTAVGR